MSAIAIKDNPAGLDFRVPVIANLGGALDMYKVEVLATCTFEIGEDSALAGLVDGMSEDEVKAQELIKTTVKMFASGLRETISDRGREVEYSEQTIAAEVAEWEKFTEEDGNTRYADSYSCRISDFKVTTVRFYDKMETAVVYEWNRSVAVAGERWTCLYCGSVVSGKFCCNCGAARG